MNDFIFFSLAINISLRIRRVDQNGKYKIKFTTNIFFKKKKFEIIFNTKKQRDQIFENYNLKQAKTTIELYLEHQGEA
mgnify:CR=1 FL=1